jgi:hypothetical protein
MANQDTPRIAEYHAQQRAVVAENEIRILTAARHAIRAQLAEIEQGLRRALASLDAHDTSAARTEIEAILDTLKGLRA